MTPADWQENRNQSCRLKIALTYSIFAEWEMWILPGFCSVAATLAFSFVTESSHWERVHVEDGCTLSPDSRVYI